MSEQPSILIVDDGGDVADVGVDRVPEQQELHDGKGGDHPQRQAIAPQGFAQDGHSLADCRH